ncbi:provirus ancestral Env polyprotein [Plecturocebus cupreus]
MTKNMPIAIGGTPLMEDVLITPVKYTCPRSATKPKTTAKMASRYSSPPHKQPPCGRSPPQVRFNLSQSPTRPDTTLTDIPLFKVHSQNFSLCYKTASSSSLGCNTTVEVKSSLYGPPGGYFWCNGTLTKVINASFPFPRVPVTLVPQLEVYGQAKLLSLLPPSPNHRHRPAVFLPVVVGLSLASSLVTAGLGSGALGYSVTSATQLEDELCVAIEALAASLASLQRHIS